MGFRYLSILEGREISDIKDIVSSRKHLWVDMVFDEETFRKILSQRECFEERSDELLHGIWLTGLSSMKMVL